MKNISTKIYSIPPPGEKLTWRYSINKQTDPFYCSLCTYCTPLAGFFKDDMSPWILSCIREYRTVYIYHTIAIHHQNWIQVTLRWYFVQYSTVRTVHTTHLPSGLKSSVTFCVDLFYQNSTGYHAKFTSILQLFSSKITCSILEPYSTLIQEVSLQTQH